MSLMKASACSCAVRGLPRERNCYLLERARSDQTLSDASSAPRVHVRPIYDDGGLRRISHGVRRMDKNVRRVHVSLSGRCVSGDQCEACGIHTIVLITCYRYNAKKTNIIGATRWESGGWARAGLEMLPPTHTTSGHKLLMLWMC